MVQHNGGAGGLRIVRWFNEFFETAPPGAAEQDEAWRTHMTAGTGAFHARRYAESEENLRAALWLAERLPSGDRRLLASLNSLGVLLAAQERFDPAEELFRRALTACEAMRPADPQTTAHSAHNLAKLCCARGQYDAAEPLCRRSLEIWMRTLPADDPQLGESLDLLGAMYAARGNLDRAESLHRRALEIMERAYGSAHAEVGRVLHNLAVIHVRRGQFELAKVAAEGALKIHESVCEPNDPQLAQELELYAGVLQHLGDDEEAAPLLARAADIRKAKLADQA